MGWIMIYAGLSNLIGPHFKTCYELICMLCTARKDVKCKKAALHKKAALPNADLKESAQCTFFAYTREPVYHHQLIGFNFIVIVTRFV